VTQREALAGGIIMWMPVSNFFLTVSKITF
jgi:hypothetical protein